MGVWDVKVVFHIYIILFFSPRFFPPSPRVTRDGRFSALSFFICFTFAAACSARARLTVIKRFGNMFRQVVIRAGADSGRSKTSSINSASADENRGGTSTAGKRKTREHYTIHQHARRIIWRRVITITIIIITISLRLYIIVSIYNIMLYSMREENAVWTKTIIPLQVRRGMMRWDDKNYCDKRVYTNMYYFS